MIGYFSSPLRLVAVAGATDCFVLNLEFRRRRLLNEQRSRVHVGVQLLTVQHPFERFTTGLRKLAVLLQVYQRGRYPRATIKSD